MATKTKQWKPRGATKGQLAARAKMFRVEPLAKVATASDTLNRCHRLGCSTLARTAGDRLVAAMAEAEL